MKSKENEMRSILYYPTIDIKSADWVRGSLMYWDEICSVVPFEGYIGSSENIQELKRLDAYKPIYPGDVFLSLEDERDFAESLNGKFKKTEEQQSSDGRQMLIHKGKFSRISIDALEEQCPGIKSVYLENSRKGDEWISVNSVFANAYMKTLAEFAVNKISNLDIGTSTQKAMDRMFASQQPAPGEHMSNSQQLVPGEQSYISIILNDCIPMPKKTVSFEEIRDYKAKSGKKLNKFRIAIEDLNRSLRECTSKEEIENKLNAFSNNINKKVEEAAEFFGEDWKHFVLGRIKSTAKAGADGFAAGALEQFVCGQGDFQSCVMAGATSGAISAVGNVIKDGYKAYSMNHDNFAYVIGASRKDMLGLTR